MSPRLTIAIPTLNRAEFLVRAIETALAQTSPDIEIIVSDNGSTHGTGEVIERYAGRGLRVFRHESTMSAARHGQFLIEQARGEFFLGLSDDDYLEPEFAAEVLAAFDRSPDLSFVYTGCAVHYGDCEVPAVVGPPIESGAAFLAEHYAGNREVSWCACVTRVRDLEQLGPQPDDRIMGDMFFWTKLAFKGPVGCVPRMLSHYVRWRQETDNISHGTPPAVWAHDSRVTADEVLAQSAQTGADREYLLRMRANVSRYIARSCANQFLWSRVRGASLIQVWGWTIDCFSYRSWSLATWTRVAAGLVLPRAMVTRLLLSGAGKLASRRAAGQAPDVSAAWNAH